VGEKWAASGGGVVRCFVGKSLAGRCVWLVDSAIVVTASLYNRQRQTVHSLRWSLDQPLACFRPDGAFDCILASNKMDGLRGCLVYRD
jgi:hypothetical protein